MQETNLAFATDEQLLYYIKDAIKTFGKSKNYSTKITIVLEDKLKVTNLQSEKVERMVYASSN